MPFRCCLMLWRPMHELLRCFPMHLVRRGLLGGCMGGVIAALLWRPLLMSLRFCVFVPLFLGAWAMELLLTVRAMHEHTCRVMQCLGR